MTHLKYSDIMGKAMFKNVSGIPGRCMGTDLNLEHMIRFLKVWFNSGRVLA